MTQAVSGIINYIFLHFYSTDSAKYFVTTMCILAASRNNPEDFQIPLCWTTFLISLVSVLKQYDPMKPQKLQCKQTADSLVRDSGVSY